MAEVDPGKQMHPLALQIMNRWQGNFPLVECPFVEIARQHEIEPHEVMEHYRDCLQSGVLSRIGAVFHQNAGGASTLAAIEVQADQLNRVAEQISSFAGVNHNYLREHRINLWFVITAADDISLQKAIHQLQILTDHEILTFPMLKSYRLNLAFDITRNLPNQTGSGGVEKGVPVVLAADTDLAALMEEGLPVVEKPFQIWANEVNRSHEEVILTLKSWVGTGLVRRFGNVLRHHELGFTANAMTVFQVPQSEIEGAAQFLAAQPELTLLYQRRPHIKWPYNLYCMVHGRDRSQVEKVLERICNQKPMNQYQHQILFSQQRLKQTGGSRFRLQAMVQKNVRHREADRVDAH